MHSDTSSHISRHDDENQTLEKARGGGGEAASLGVVKRFLKNNAENGISLAFMCVFSEPVCVCVCVF